MTNSRLVHTSREEALALFTVWKSDRALIRIEFRFRILAATFCARVAEASDARLALISDDHTAELLLPVPLSATFQYLDLRDSPRGDVARMLVLLYPFVPDPNESDQVAFTELVNTRTEGHIQARVE